MLSALRLSTEQGFQRGIFAAGTASPALHCRIIFKDVRDDRLARRLFAGKRRLDARDAESAGTFDQQHDFDRAGGGHRSVQRSAGFGGARCSRNTRGAANGCSNALNEIPGPAMPASRRRVLCFPGCSWLPERHAEVFGRFHERVAGERANGRYGWRGIWRGWIHSHFVCDFFGSFAGRCGEN